MLEKSLKTYISPPTRTCDIEALLFCLITMEVVLGSGNCLSFLIVIIVIIDKLYVSIDTKIETLIYIPLSRKKKLLST